MGKKLWGWVENIAYFFVYKIFHINLSEAQWATFLQFIKFGLVGVSNNLICYLVYLALVMLGVHYVLANVIGFTVSVFNSYYWNNKYVFVTENKRIWWKTFLKTYVSYAGTGIVLSNILLVIWIEKCGISAVIAPFINLIVTIPINFLVNKLWAYKR